MKRVNILTAALAVAITFTLNACSGDDGNGDGNSSSSGISSSSGGLSSSAEADGSSSSTEISDSLSSSAETDGSSSSAETSNSSSSSELVSKRTKGDLWGPNDEQFPFLRVAYSDVKTCWASNLPDEEGKYSDGTYDNPCLTQTGGLFYGYAENGGSNLKVKIDGAWASFETAYETGLSHRLLPLTDAQGRSLIGNGFQVAFYAGSSGDGSKPGFAGIDSYTRASGPDGKPIGGQNVEDKGGICVVYALRGSPIKLGLGWDEATYYHNIFQAELPEAPAGRVIDLTWDATKTGITSGDFSRENFSWDPTWNHDIEKALKDLRYVRFELINRRPPPEPPLESDFVLCELGWKGTCGSTYSCDPIK
ncbi:MAG: hypothetical protein LBH25_02960 [Fibromonadaceae bacterium]|jgi:hypothetical protein|nr:hypothetical protein [Fibromonadaceae bacterium]